MTKCRPDLKSAHAMCAATSDDEHAVSMLAMGPRRPNVKPIRPLATL